MEDVEKESFLSRMPSGILLSAGFLLIGTAINAGSPEATVLLGLGGLMVAQLGYYRSKIESTSQELLHYETASDLLKAMPQERVRRHNVRPRRFRL